MIMEVCVWTSDLVNHSMVFVWTAARPICIRGMNYDVSIQRTKQTWRTGLYAALVNQIAITHSPTSIDNLREYSLVMLALQYLLCWSNIQLWKTVQLLGLQTCLKTSSINFHAPYMVIYGHGGRMRPHTDHKPFITHATFQMMYHFEGGTC